MKGECGGSLEEGVGAGEKGGPSQGCQMASLGAKFVLIWLFTEVKIAIAFFWLLSGSI